MTVYDKPAVDTYEKVLTLAPMSIPQYPISFYANCDGIAVIAICDGIATAFTIDSGAKNLFTVTAILY